LAEEHSLTLKENASSVAAIEPCQASPLPIRLNLEITIIEGYRCKGGGAVRAVAPTILISNKIHFKHGKQNY